MTFSPNQRSHAMEARGPLPPSALYSPDVERRPPPPADGRDRLGDDLDWSSDRSEPLMTRQQRADIIADIIKSAGKRGMSRPEIGLAANGLENGFNPSNTSIALGDGVKSGRLVRVGRGATKRFYDGLQATSTAKAANQASAAENAAMETQIGGSVTNALLAWAPVKTVVAWVEKLLPAPKTEAAQLARRELPALLLKLRHGAGGQEAPTLRNLMRLLTAQAEDEEGPQRQLAQNLLQAVGMMPQALAKVVLQPKA
ncbi:hypothetical protein E3E12_02570 [Formicincola oecophyllae]|uniref:Uncharacterized protein n=1 Tax=Formicincola oecophyllae TaxID=2558361 RepID=A0A4Y6U8G2_9PROT|nr:hypothetical protein [Formicincola oecophyllae]QDH13270.1 hypothetical protein E3E12_02570 [Formicincola oecophyllae]